MNNQKKIYALDEAGLANVIKSLTQPPGGGGGTTTGLEARVAKMESDVGHARSDISEIKGDLRTLLYALVGSFLILAGMMLFGYFRLADKIDQIPRPAPPPVAQKSS